MKTKLLIIALLFLPLRISVKAENVEGNGQMVTKDITINDYNKISVSNSVEILYEQKPGKPYLQLTIDENLLPYVVAEVKSGELKLGYKKSWTNNYRATKFRVVTNSTELIKFTMGGSGNVQLKNVESKKSVKISISGSGRVEAENLRTGDLELAISGSGNIRTMDMIVGRLAAKVTGSGDIVPAGKAQVAEYKITGSGCIYGYECEVEDVKAGITGSGNIEVKATKYLKGSITGSGSVLYKGRPAVESKTSGSGKVRSTND